MLGTNPKRPQLKDHGGHDFAVTEVFPTIQGEGPDAGVPAIFIRMAGCNLACWFCDTEFEKFEPMSLNELVNQVVVLTRGHKLVVITGGEPFRQNLDHLIEKLNDLGYHVQIETAGTLWWDWIEYHFPKRRSAINRRSSSNRNIITNTIVCSPKTPKLHPKIVPYILALKYIGREGALGARGLPSETTTANPHDADGGYKARGPALPEEMEGNHFEPRDIYLQPMDEDMGAGKEATSENVAACLRSCELHGYRFSYQVHKAIGAR